MAEASIICPDCKSAVPEEARFCPRCRRPRTHVAGELQRQAEQTGVAYPVLLARAQRGIVHTRQPLPIRHMPAQDQTGWVYDIATAVTKLLTDDEELLYIAVQDQKAPTIKKAGIVATTNRLIIYRPKMIGSFAFTDIYWQDVMDVHLKQGMVFSTFTVTNTSGRAEVVEHMTRETSQRLYSIAQQYERDWRERRRIRTMEEDRAKAGGVTVNTTTYQPPSMSPPIDVYAAPIPAISAASDSDPVARLAKAKTLLDQGLIDDDEYDALKVRILSEI